MYLGEAVLEIVPQVAVVVVGGGTGRVPQLCGVRCSASFKRRASLPAVMLPQQDLRLLHRKQTYQRQSQRI